VGGLAILATLARYALRPAFPFRALVLTPPIIAGVIAVAAYKVNVYPYMAFADRVLRKSVAVYIIRIGHVQVRRISVLSAGTFDPAHIIPAIPIPYMQVAVDKIAIPCRIP